MVEPIAIPADLEVDLARDFTQDEFSRALVLLGRASDRVRAYTGQQFTRVLDDVAVLRVDRGQVFLPQWPNDKPTLIEYADGSGVIGAGSWWWGGVGVVDLSPPSWVGNGPSWSSMRRVDTVRVTYSHGYDEVPSDVVGVVVGMVARVMAVPGLMPGLREGQVDDFRFALGGTLTTGSVALTVDDTAVLDKYRRRTGSVAFR